MKKKVLIILFVLLLIAGGVGAYFYFTADTDTTELIGRDFIINATSGNERTYLYIVDEDTAHFSSDVGNEVKYSKWNKTITFFDVYFQGEKHNKLYASVTENDNYKDSETYQYYFLNFYSAGIKREHIALTYPDDTLVTKTNILKTFNAVEFEQVSHDAPSFLPDEHETPAELSSIDQIALNLFKEVVQISFESNYICKAVLKNNQVLTGKYAHFRQGDIYLNFGEPHVSGHQVIKMLVYDQMPNPTPRYYGGEEEGKYDPRYSNLTPPPYYLNTNLFIYWQDQDSRYIIR